MTNTEVAVDDKMRRCDEAMIKDLLLKAYSECGYRRCKQGHQTCVEVVKTPSVKAETVRGGAYSHSCTFRKVTSVHTLRVCGDWLRTVYDRGLATWNGRLVLAVTPAGCAGDGTHVFELTTVKQGRGTALEVEKVTVPGGWRLAA